jgi:ABC-2 type transport system permease protein
MDKLIAIIKREYIERVRTKWFLIATLLGPLLFLGMSVLPALLVSREKASVMSTNITIIDATGTALGERVAGVLADSGTMKPELAITPPTDIAAAESLATRSVMNRSREGYLILDALTLQGSKARYTGRNTTTVRDMRLIGNAVDRAVLALRLEGTGITRARIDSLTRVDVTLDKTQLTEKGRAKSGAGSTILGIIVAFLLYIVLILYGQTVLRSVIEEKTTRVAEVVISSVRPEVLLAGKIIGIGGVAMTQMAAWLASSFWMGANIAPMILKRSLPAAGSAVADSVSRTTEIFNGMPSWSAGLILALALFFLLGFIFYSCLYAAVGSTVNSESEAQQASTPVVMLLIMSVIFVQPVALAPQSKLAIVSSMLPFSAPIVMPMRMSLVSVPLWQVATSLIGLALAAAAAIWFSARIYRVGLLMYGKRPSIGELFKWLRYS